ncbi:MAG: TRAM domain-containing protein [Fimbriimonas ginsengisoli]|uniref:TRAM domain-containing protein n=1 Tax=Fimbriimonas ginsengisoli TaxID=1005039 RepID=A0A931LV99_FIMGI|nr:TRAM domain-containing protein [Fimbriimonas ginsengisoli]
MRARIAVVGLAAAAGAVSAGAAAPLALDSLFGYAKGRIAATAVESGEAGVRHPHPQKQAAGKTTPPTSTHRTEVGGVAMTQSEEHYPLAHSWGGILPFAMLGAMLGAYLGSRVYDGVARLLSHWDKMDSGDRLTSVIGVFAGLVMSFPLISMFTTLPLERAWIPWLVLILTVGCITVSLYMMQSISEFFPWKRGRGPMKRSGVKLLDTNVIIDGRIYDVARNGFVEGRMYVPQFVLEELQHIADHHDPLRRQRGRRGLDVLRHMQADFQLEVGTQDRLAPDIGDSVDSRLVRLARAIGADLVTNDHNLNRVAGLQEVKVLNLNDLALALRPNVLPQETLNLTLIREGNQPGQGIGYLDDGTMVVIENGRSHIGETLDIEVTQVIQTERGKMIFGEILDEESPENGGQRRRPNGPKK